MRHRKIRNLDEKMEAVACHIATEPENNKGQWLENFPGCHKLFLEIGCGKGKFMTTMAKENPKNAYIGIEGQRTVLYRTLEKIEEGKLNNVITIDQYVDPGDLEKLFEKDELDGIFLNFSDPWPKERHEKRRLTYGKRLIQYVELIKDGGFIQFKTDNEGLFEYSLEQIEETNLKILKMTRDLHNSTLEERKVTTEYEDKFKETGKNINMVTIEVVKAAK
ncbi:MAG: tRNA (guanosine(46)-N7)-methyltransferase TrmB [Clostridia bacterium]|nr:tRNA (guanosine(46)-N7)-methyltransferase TrmB [Clostridia bacterium]